MWLRNHRATARTEGGAVSSYLNHGSFHFHSSHQYNIPIKPSKILLRIQEAAKEHEIAIDWGIISCLVLNIPEGAIRLISY